MKKSIFVLSLTIFAGILFAGLCSQMMQFGWMLLFLGESFAGMFVMLVAIVTEYAEAKHGKETEKEGSEPSD